jgi:hypothetical protein
MGCHFKSPRLHLRSLLVDNAQDHDLLVVGPFAVQMSFHRGANQWLCRWYLKMWWQPEPGAEHLLKILSFVLSFQSIPMSVFASPADCSHHPTPVRLDKLIQMHFRHFAARIFLAYIVSVLRVCTLILTKRRQWNSGLSQLMYQYLEGFLIWQGIMKSLCMVMESGRTINFSVANILTFMWCLWKEW